MSDQRELEPVDRRPDNEANPSGMTGVCANGEHVKCRGRVYAGHTLGHHAQAVYQPCSCDCHDEPGEDALLEAA